MRCFQADYVFPVNGPPIEKGLVLTDEEGVILDVLAPGQAGAPGLSPELLQGILVPGFINTHCHLELSCMKGVIGQGGGLAGFIREILARRPGFGADAIRQGIEAGEEEMLRSGIVAVGDISNTDATFARKAEGLLYYHTFIEAFDLHPSRTEQSFARARQLREQLAGQERKGGTSVVAHAPYTVTPGLHRLINAYAAETGGLLSIHSQESQAENELFLGKEGSIWRLFREMGLDFSWFEAPQCHSLRSTLAACPEAPGLLLVHNTYASEEDIGWAMNQMGSRLCWASCPNANLYIEGRLPDYPAFIRQGARMSIGTDSLASNHCLSVLEELKTISKYYPQIDFSLLLKWATINGAEFLGIEAGYGSIEKGKKPGLVLIEQMEGLQLGPASRSRRII